MTERLLGELPGILNWAIKGLASLRKRGHFEQPKSSADAIQNLADLGSPIGAFVEERCIVGQGRTVPIDDLFAAWCDWCLRQGRSRHGTAQNLGKMLRASVPELKVTQPRTEAGDRF